MRTVTRRKVWWIAGGVGVVVLAVLVGRSQKEPTLDEFIAEYTAAMNELDNLEYGPVPTRTGDLAQFRQALADDLRSDALKREPIIAKLQDMRAPSDPSEAEALRLLMLETLKLRRDDSLQMASAIENGEPLADPAIFAAQIVENMRLIVDLADAIGMDTTEFRQWREAIDNDFASGS